MYNRNMKHLRDFCVVLSICIILLTSCTIVNHRTNYFVPGSFTGKNMNNNNEIYTLNVSEISENEYKNSNGKNVIKDLVRPGFYLLEFFYFNENNTKILINFYDFIDLYEGSRGAPIVYKDKNDYYLEPYFNEKNESSSGYRIQYKNNNYVLNCYLS